MGVLYAFNNTKDHGTEVIIYHGVTANEMLNLGERVSKDGSAFYAIDDSCPFDSALLSDGFLNGSVVECVGDKARFFVPTGECLSQPEGKHLRSYRVRVDKEDVLVDLGQSLAPRSKREIEVGYKLERQEKEQKRWRTLCQSKIKSISVNLT